MNPTPFGGAHPALAAPTHGTARRWRAGASFAALALVATPFVAAPASATEADPAASTAAAADVPVFTGTVQVDGTPTVGAEVSLVVAGTWAPEPESLAYAWYLSDDSVFDGTDVRIDAADGLTAPIRPEHVGKYVIGAVAGTVGAETSEYVASAGVGPVAPGDLAAGTPTISGTPRVGTKLTAQPGSWPEGTDLTYRWRVSNTTVATTSTFTPQAAHAGKSLRLVVTGTKDGYAAKTAYSAYSSIARASFVTTTPKINGTVRIGGLVGATTGHFSPTATLKYQWKADGRTIVGATSRTYTIHSSRHGDKLTVTVTGSRAGYTTKSVTSAASVVSKPFSRTVAPTISGTRRVGETLTANRGTWTPSPSSVAYQWKANGKAIPGATGRTYFLTRGEYGKQISVEVTGRKYSYLTTTRRSGSTAAVKWPVGVGTPNVTTHPTRYVETTVGRTVTLKASATGGRLTYQWQRWTPATGTWNNVGAKSSTYRFTAGTSHELNQFRVVVSNMAGKDTSNRSYVWVQSTLASPFPTNQWFSLWNYNALVTESNDNFNGYLAADVFVCAAPGYSVAYDVSVRFVGNDGKVYSDAGQDEPYHVSWGVPLDDDGCGSFVAYSKAPQSVRAGGKWRITDVSDGQTYRQYAKYTRSSQAMTADPSARAFLDSETVAPRIDSPSGSVPLVGARGAFTD